MAQQEWIYDKNYGAWYYILAQSGYVKKRLDWELLPQI